MDSAEPAREPLAVPIDSLELPARTRDTLRRAGIMTAGDLSARDEAELLAIANIGPRSVADIRETLASLGLALRPGTPAAAETATATVPPLTRVPSPRSAPAGSGGYDDEAIALLSEARFPVARRLLPALCAAAALLLVALRARHRHRRGGR